ncbi:MAG: enoyl-CoA hydratase/isomerase family protein [Planctomycetes bacterium]|nr:enoyl-CoA hydratase/isomerase family protein [Planctomycetota bacterium]
MPETPPSVRLTTTEQVATVVLDAPARGNALDAAMLERLEELLRGLDPDVRVVLVRGAGERAFSTGYHVPSLLAELEQGPSVSDFDGHPLERALRALEAVPVPTVALVRGNAYGAGCELALACDLRLAADDARLCMPPAKLGVLYSATGMRRLLELCGPALAKELLFTGDVIDAGRALALGLVNRVVPAADLEQAGQALAATIRANAPLSLRHTKTIFARHLAPPPLDAAALADVARLRDECFRSAEFQARSRALGRRATPVVPPPAEG